MSFIESIASSSYAVWGCLGFLVLLMAGYMCLMTVDRFAELRQTKQYVFWGLTALIAVSMVSFILAAYVHFLNLDLEAYKEDIIGCWLITLVITFIVLIINTVKMLPKP